MDVSSIESMPVSLAARQNAGGAPGAAPAIPARPNVLSTAATPAAKDAQQATTPEAIGNAIKQVNSAFSEMGHDIYASYGRDKTTGFTIVQFHDKNTGEVIQQIPSKQILAIAQSLSLLPGLQGQLISDKA